MKNLFNSASCGNPAKFVWQQAQPGNNPAYINDIKNHIVSDEEVDIYKKKIDTTKTSLTEIKLKIKEMDAKRKEIDDWTKKEKEGYVDTTGMMNEYSHNKLVEEAEKSVNSKLMVLTTAKEIALMSELGITTVTGKTNRELLRPVLVDNEVKKNEQNLKEQRKNEYYAQVDQNALEKRMALTTELGESYTDLLLAENTLTRKQEELKARYEDMLEMQKFLAENDINDPEYAKVITDARTDMIKDQNKATEALALETAKHPFTKEQIGNSAYEMMKNIPGAQRQEAFKANFPEEDFSKYKLGKGLTAAGNTMLFEALK